MPTVPAPQTLSISTRDKINYQGKQVGITNVSAGVDNGLGTVVYTLTLDAAGSPTISVSANNCVLNNPGTEASSTGIQVWSKTGQAS